MFVVTGANGFLGSYVVCSLLDKGLEVMALRRDKSDMSEFNDIFSQQFGVPYQQHPLLKWKEVDLLDILSLDEWLLPSHIVVHCAAQVSFLPKDKMAMTVSNVNVTKNLVDACIKASVKKMVYVSSTAAIGRSKVLQNIDEDCYWEESEFNSDYAISKHNAELEVWRGIEEGLNAVIVNPSIILGYGNWAKGSCALFKSVASGMKFYTKGVNGFVGVKDVAELIFILSQSEIKGQRFIVNSENCSYQFVFNTMAKALGKAEPTFEIKSQYEWFFKLGIRFMHLFGVSKTINAQTIHTSLNQFNYSSDKIRKQLDYTFQPIQAVIQETAQKYQSK
jgi:dihydroflavonol-4-reductase